MHTPLTVIDNLKRRNAPGKRSDAGEQAVSPYSRGSIRMGRSAEFPLYTTLTHSTLFFEDQSFFFVYQSVCHSVRSFVYSFVCFN